MARCVLVCACEYMGTFKRILSHNLKMNFLLCNGLISHTMFTSRIENWLQEGNVLYEKFIASIGIQNVE